VLRPSLSDEKSLHDLYLFSHAFAVEFGKKNLEIETANALWQLFLGSRCDFLDKWQKFLEVKLEKKELLVVSLDVWEQFFGLYQ